MRPCAGVGGAAVPGRSYCSDTKILHMPLAQEIFATSNSTLVPKLLLVPAPGVHCHPRSVLGEVVFDDIGRFPAGSSAKCEAV